MGTVYKMALSSTELSNVYSHPCDAPDTTNLKLWLPLKSYHTSVSHSGYAEGSYPGSTIKDYSKYGATGTYVKNTSRPYDIAWDWTFDTTYFVNGTAVCQWKDYKVADGYRFAFNGKEKDDETYGDGDEYDFGARIYDSRVGRWMGCDPLEKKYPSMSSYSFAGNSPVAFYDPDGKEVMIFYKDKAGNPQAFAYKPGIKPPENDFVKKVCDAISYNMHSAKGAEVWNDLIASNGVVTIMEKQATGTDEKEVFKAGGSEKYKGPDGKSTNKTLIGSIGWDPDSRIQANDGAFITGFLAPSTALLHEAGHAQEYDKAQKEGLGAILQYSYNQEEYNKQYDNLEEKRNIEKVEDVYVKEINAWEQTNYPDKPSYQPVRANHKAYVFWFEKNDVNTVDSSDFLLYRKNIKTETGSYPDDGVKDTTSKK